MMMMMMMMILISLHTFLFSFLLQLNPEVYLKQNDSDDERPLITQRIANKNSTNIINLSVSMFCSNAIRAAKSNYFECYALLAATLCSSLHYASSELHTSIWFRCFARPTALRFARRSTMFSAFKTVSATTTRCDVRAPILSEGWFTGLAT